MQHPNHIPIKMLLGAFVLLLVCGNTLTAKAQDSSGAPTNPFRNLPKNPDPRTNNPFNNKKKKSSNTNQPAVGGDDQDQERREAEARERQERGDGRADNGERGGRKSSKRDGGSRFKRSKPTARTPRPSRTSRSSSRTSSGGKRGLKPGDKLILGPRKKDDHARNNEVVENFQFPEAELLDVAKAIARLTGRNFIYNPQEVKGKISILSESAVTVHDAWKAFLTALDMKGYTVIPSGEYLRIERSQAAKEKQVPIYAGRYSPDTDQYITRIISLKYINAKEVEQTFRLWIPRQGRMYAYEQTNTLIITDTAAHIRRFMELISILDVRGYQETLEVIQIRYAVAKDLAKTVEQLIYGGPSSSSSSRRSTSRRSGSNANRRFKNSSSSKGRAGGTQISHVIPVERTNSLVVKANKAGHLEIRVLIRKLDTKRAATQGTGRIHVVQLQFADAEELAKSLGAIAKNKPSSKRRGNRVGTFSPPGSDQLVANIFQGEILVSPDKNTQSLIITAAPQDFQTLKGVIEKLDIPRDQVFVEAIIMEVTLRRNNGFGLSFANARNGIFFPSRNLNSLISGTPNPGLSLGFKKGADIELANGVSVPGLFGLIELLQSNANANIIATPQIIAIDNQEAEIEISDTIPVETRTVTNSSESVSFKNEKASLRLKVTPHINKASDFVRLEIEQSLEEFSDALVPAALVGRATGKSTRSTKTSVVVQDDDTVVISGLIRERAQETVNKVPLLGDIPVIGWLFKNSSVEVTKTDLLIFITPHIIKQYSKIRSLLNTRLKDRNVFVRENLGGEDPHSQAINKIRKSLPDLTEIRPLARINDKRRPRISTPARPEEDQYPEAEIEDFPEIPENLLGPQDPPPASPVWKDPAKPGFTGGVLVDPGSGDDNGGDGGGDDGGDSGGDDE